MLRVEDLDGPRVVPGSMDAILDDLRWIGLDWDEGPGTGGAAGPYLQSERIHLYEAALAGLAHARQVYPCDCSRAEIARSASAPHPGEEGPIYPGTCRDRREGRAFKRAPAMRLRVQPGEVCFHDRVHGLQRADVARETGDFVLRRGDGVFAYQLAVVVDDLEMRITEVVRGADLLGSTGRQIALAKMLGAEPPSFAHAPLVIGPQGDRLAKRARGVVLRDHRAHGVRPGRVVALLARILGLGHDGMGEVSARDLVGEFAWSRVRRAPVRVDPIELRVVGETD